MDAGGSAPKVGALGDAGAVTEVHINGKINDFR
jgi:hypothetical protein